MRLYNLNTGKIENIKTFVFEGIEHIISKQSEAQLNNIGLYRIAFESPYDRRYYINTQIKELVGNLYITSYTKIDKPVEQVQALMVKDLFVVADKYEDEAIVDTGLGYNVKGSAKALKAFEVGAKRGILEVRDEYYKKHTVTVPQMAQIVADGEDNAISLFNIKGRKFDEIEAFQTVAECVYYEATPKDVESPILDEVTGEPTGETEMITIYINNVKEW